MNLVHTTIHALERELILTCRAIVRNTADSLCQLFVISRYGSRIAQCAEVLARIKAVGGCISKGSGALLAPKAAMCLCIVFNEKEVVKLTQLADQRCVSTSPIEMYEHDGTCLRCYSGLNESIVKL